MNKPYDSFFAKVILVPVEDVAETYLHVELNHLNQLIKKGEMPFIVMQGTEMIRMWDLMEFIERNLQRYDPSGKLLDAMRTEMNGESDG